MLKTAHIRRRQRQLGLSNRDLARATALSAPRIGLMLDGHHHQTLTLKQLDRLSEALACSITDLLASEGEHPSEKMDATTTPLAALLHAAKRAIPAAVLADATDSTIEQVEEQLPALDQQLQTIGLRIRRDTNDNAISIVPDSSITDEQLQIVLRGSASRLQLDEGTARLIHRILSGPTTKKAVDASNDGRVRLGQLINAGIVLAPARDTEPLQFADDTIESLLLDVR